MTDKERIIIKYYKEYLLFTGTFDEHYSSEFYTNLVKLIGTSWIDWFINFVKKYDLDEWRLIQTNFSTKKGMGGYFKGEENSPAYRWLIKFCRDVELEKLLENEKYDRNYESV
jgi:hypothetical protein